MSGNTRPAEDEIARRILFLALHQNAEAPVACEFCKIGTALERFVTASFNAIAPLSKADATTEEAAEGLAQARKRLNLYCSTCAQGNKQPNPIAVEGEPARI